jgi:hypothetical protein
MAAAPPTVLALIVLKSSFFSYLDIAILRGGLVSAPLGVTTLYLA